MFLSKSTYVAGLQCPKYLWLRVNKPDAIPEADEALKHRFEQGHLVGAFAKKLFPKGIDIPTKDFKENIHKTKELLKKKLPLFEAGFFADPVYSRIDILVPAKDEWDIIEVKSGTKVEDVHIQDVSFQKFCCEKAGLKIRKCFLMHINNEYVRKGDIDVKKLFVKEEIIPEMDGIQEKIDEMLKIISGKVCPAIDIHPNCKNPYACPLMDECWKHIPSGSVFELYRIGKKAFELFESGVVSIKDVDIELKGNQKIQKECASGKVHVDKQKIKEFLSGFKTPVYYLDFETFGTAIPLFDGVKPYSQIPFQFSLHVQDKHYSFIASGGDPRKEFILALKKVLGDSGSIIAYNASFEQNVLKNLAECFPQEKKWIESVIDRMIDLLIPFRNFYYYNPSQQGSASIKKVLPAVTGKSYDSLEINHGGEASLQYLYMIYGKDGKKPSEKEIKKIRENLEKYCGLDTEGMVWIVRDLGKIW